MAIARRSLQSIKTMGALLDNRRSRSRSGALLELSVMASERLRLNLELERWRHRRAEIDTRLAEIGAKEERLLASAQDRCATEIVAGSRIEPVARPKSQARAAQRVRATEITY